MQTTATKSSKQEQPSDAKHQPSQANNSNRAKQTTATKPCKEKAASKANKKQPSKANNSNQAKANNSSNQAKQTTSTKRSKQPSRLGLFSNPSVGARCLATVSRRGVIQSVLFRSVLPAVAPSHQSFLSVRFHHSWVGSSRFGPASRGSVLPSRLSRSLSF
jgi:uncharacterized protein (DUF2342 family)